MSEDRDLTVEIWRAISALDEERTVNLVKKAVELKTDLMNVLENGLTKGIRELGERFAQGEAFLTDLIMAGSIMNEAVEILKPFIEKTQLSAYGKILLGTVEGDIHDIGKNIVSLLLQASGFDVYDLGKDVPTSTFIEKIKELKPDVVGASSLLTTTMENQRRLVEALIKNGLRDRVKVIIGGAPVTSEWAQEIGADAYGEDAVDAVGKVKTLTGKS